VAKPREPILDVASPVIERHKAWLHQRQIALDIFGQRALRWTEVQSPKFCASILLSSFQHTESGTRRESLLFGPGPLFRSPTQAMTRCLPLSIL
jgi:hypothetical protein